MALKVSELKNNVLGATIRCTKVRHMEMPYPQASQGVGITPLLLEILNVGHHLEMLSQKSLKC